MQRSGWEESKPLQSVYTDIKEVTSLTPQPIL